MVSARKRPSYADIQALPSHLRGEIIAGELVVHPRPAPPHVHAAGALGIFVGGPFGFGVGGPGGWWIEPEPELSLGVDQDFDPIIPDLAGWRRERMPALPETAQFTLVPDWVCEVLSPSTQAIDRADKMPFYLRADVKHAWLVDPIQQTLEVFRQENGRWSILGVHKGSAVVRAEPFDAVELHLAQWWARA